MTVDEFVERTEHTPTDAEWANLMREYNRNFHKVLKKFPP